MDTPTPSTDWKECHLILLAEGVEIGPYAVIGSEVVLHDKVKIAKAVNVKTITLDEATVLARSEDIERFMRAFTARARGLERRAGRQGCGHLGCTATGRGGARGARGGGG